MLIVPGVCVNTEQFVQRHSAVEEGWEINPLTNNYLRSIKLLRKLRSACGGKGFEGKFYRLIVNLLPLGMKLYGKYNEIEIITIPGVFEFGGPSLYGF